jgi:hypothetical protein
MLLMSLESLRLKCHGALVYAGSMRVLTAQPLGVLAWYAEPSKTEDSKHVAASSNMG